MHQTETAELTQAIPEERLLRLDHVMSRVGLGRSTIYRRINQGTFPAPVKLGHRAVAWRESDINRWIHQRTGAA